MNANKGLSGLANVGNTCYLNSCMQVISHTTELNDLLSDGTYKNKLNQIPESIILIEWDKLRKMLWAQNCTVAPYGFVKAVQRVAALKKREIFTGYAQNDVGEFLLFIFESFHNALHREVEMQITGSEENPTDKLASICYTMMKNMYKADYSELLNIFYGIHVSEITSMNGGKILSLTPEPFSVLSLPIPSGHLSVQLFDCLDLHCQKEKLEGDNAWYNDVTKLKEPAERSILFWSLPKILIIDLKRWHNHKQKVQTFVNAPLSQVNFSKYVKGYNANSYIYDLYGVCNHSGGVHGGHYTAYIKNENGKWYAFNDTLINEIKEEQVVTQNSYCFFYRKKK